MPSLNQPKADRLNSGKPKMSLLRTAMHALIGCTRVLEFGAQKYSRDNWKKGLRYTEIVDSFDRHANAFMNGEDFDPESDLPHVDHMLCNALFLSEMYHTRKDCDDRHPSTD